MIKNLYWLPQIPIIISVLLCQLKWSMYKLSFNLINQSSFTKINKNNHPIFKINLKNMFTNVVFVMKIQFSCNLTTNYLTLTQRETHGCIVSTVATDALVLKHQAISIHNAD